MWRGLLQKYTMGAQQWGPNGRKENKSKHQEAKDETDWKRVWEKKVKARLEIDGVIVDCWSTLILVSQGCCLGRLASFSFSNLWLSLGVDQTWQPVYFSLFFLSCQPLYSSKSLSFSSFISFLSYYCGFIPLSTFLVFFLSLSLQTVRHHAESSGLEKEQQERGEFSQPRVKGESGAG